MDSEVRPAATSGASGGLRIRLRYIIIATVIGAVALTSAGRHIYFRAKINAELRAIRRAGFPTTMQELEAYYPAPKGRNAADIYLAAFAASPYLRPAYDSDQAAVVGPLPPRGQALPKEMRAAISAFLAANAQALKLLHQAAGVEGCRFALSWSLDLGQYVEHHGQLGRAARLPHLEAILRAEEGKPDEAFEAIEDSFAVARALRNEPLLKSQFARYGMDDASLGALERVLSWTALADCQLAELAARIGLEESQQPFARAMAGQRCLFENDFRTGEWRKQMKVPSKNPYIASALAGLYSFLGNEAQDEYACLKAMSGAVEAASGPIKGWRARAFAPNPNAREAELPLAVLTPGSFTPYLSGLFRLQLEGIARLRAASAGIAVERYRVANGRLPASLDELVPKWLPAVPSDPFDGKPIRYKKLSKGFVTYSIGPDLKDDGGAERGQSNYAAGYNVTFIIAR